MDKEPFDIDGVLARVRESIRGFADAAMFELAARGHTSFFALPRAHWVELNRLLVPFGKHVCTGTRPRCSTCPVLSMCRQVGVRNPR